MAHETDYRELVPGLVNAACPVPGIVGGGQPTPGHLAALAAAGFRTVLDLRAPQEQRGYDQPAQARAAGIEYVNLPVVGAPTDDTYERVRALLADPGRRPILVHCGSGNRVGGVLLPYLVLDEGKDPEEALRLAVEMGLRSQPLADLAFDYIARSGYRFDEGAGREDDPQG
jgi:uncharacterized protein (TIGR01244 family)